MAFSMRNESRVLFLVFSLFLVLPLSAGEVYQTGTELRTISTEHFIFIFPEESRTSAIHLASFAEEVLKELKNELGQGLKGQIPVSLSPHSSALNGWATLVPYPRIMLFDTVIDSDWTVFPDTLRGVFTHELAHILSLSSRDPWIAFLSGIFGNWVSPTALNAAPFMVEGVTVSHEAGSGPGGRAQDPLVRQRLYQDNLENRFKSPEDLRGTYDSYPWGTLYYEYGGLFSAYLIENWGREKYQALWKALGTVDLWGSLGLDSFSPLFRKVYGLSLEEAWASFRHAYYPGLVNPASKVSGLPLFPFDPPEMVSGGGRLWWVDPRTGNLVSWTPGDTETQTHANLGIGTVVHSWRPDPEGGSLLVSRQERQPDGRFRLRNGIVSLDSGRVETLFPFLDALLEPQFLDSTVHGQSIIGIRPRQSQTDLVLRDALGNDQLLARGRTGLSFSEPRVLPDGRIALLLVHNGIRSLNIVDPKTRTAMALDMDIKHIRDISVDQGTIYFNAVLDDSFYRLAWFDGSRVFVQKNNTSGGIFKPVALDGSLYAFGRFSRGSALLELDGDPGAYAEQSVLVRDNSAILTLDTAQPTGSFTEHKPYQPILWANPFSSWFLYPDLMAVDRTLRYHGAFLFADPMGEQNALLVLGHDTGAQMAEIGVSWQTSALPMGVSLSASDTMRYPRSLDRYRAIEVQASLDYTHNLDWSNQYLGISLGGLYLQGAFDPGTDGSAYLWPFSGPQGLGSLTLAHGVYSSPRIPGSPHGYIFSITGDLSLPDLSQRASVELRWGLDPLPFRIYGFASWSSVADLSLDGTAGTFGLARFEELREFNLPSRRFGFRDWRIFGLDARAQGVNQEVNDQWLFLYVRRFLLDGGYRGAWFDSSWLHSVYVRLTARAALAPAMEALDLEAWGELAMRINDLSLAGTNPFSLQFGISVPGLVLKGRNLQ